MMLALGYTTKEIDCICSHLFLSYSSLNNKVPLIGLYVIHCDMIFPFYFDYNANHFQQWKVKINFSSRAMQIHTFVFYKVIGIRSLHKIVCYENTHSPDQSPLREYLQPGIKALSGWCWNACGKGDNNTYNTSLSLKLKANGYPLLPVNNMKQ